MIPAVTDSNSTEYEVVFTPDDTKHYHPATCQVKLFVAEPFGQADFILPDDIMEIHENAFERTDASIVYIPDTCQSIGDHAFCNCISLIQIRIPEKCTVGKDAFDGCDMVYVFGTPDSPADTYCRNHDNCVFVEEDKAVTEESND